MLFFLLLLQVSIELVPHWTLGELPSGTGARLKRKIKTRRRRGNEESASESEYEDASSSESSVDVKEDPSAAEAKAAAALELRVVDSAGEWYSVRLLRQPLAPVRINCSLRSDVVALEPASVVFTPSDWRVARHVYVAARTAADATPRAKRSGCHIWHSVVSEDASFHALPLPALTVRCLTNASGSAVGFGSNEFPEHEAPAPKAVARFFSSFRETRGCRGSRACVYISRALARLYCKGSKLAPHKDTPL